ncbi:4-hydroxyphenylacetate decarboxylase small subunit [Sporomusa rhizae]|uniref:4-hydroxyphenylacetate decarboxylase small subunit n=1 Tax=Sporomusa rhizae TaxID=357999 RepID=UPI00352A56A8
MSMRHYDCKNYINLDCEKGMCAVSKGFVPIDGEGSQACPQFKQAEKCGNCKNFINSDKYGVGTCTGLEKENWAYATCGAFACRGYAAK